MNKETITFAEFKSFINGLVVGKKGHVPDFDDWIKIKEMMDKVQPDEISMPYPFIPMPYCPPHEVQPTYQPFPPTYAPWLTFPVTCKDTVSPSPLWKTTGTPPSYTTEYGTTTTNFANSLRELSKIADSLKELDVNVGTYTRTTPKE